MTENEYWSDWVLNLPAQDSDIKSVENFLGRELPSEYVDFLRRNDGGEGFIFENYLILWRVSELLEFNRNYEVEKYASGLFLFGSDGGGEGYGFDMRGQELVVVTVPFVGMSLRYARVVAASFEEFIQKLRGQLW